VVLTGTEGGGMRDIHGDSNGRHRQQDKKWYHMVNYGMDYNDIRPFDILLVQSKSFIGAGIKIFSHGWLNHAGQILRKNNDLVVSEANFPAHQLTPMSSYLLAQRQGKCKLTIVRIDESVWPSIIDRDHARLWCHGWHMAQEGKKYTVGTLVPMALWGMVRAFTPFFRGNFKSIPVPGSAFICSAIVDYGWYAGQCKLMLDFFPSTLGVEPSPQDLYDSPYTKFVMGWKREEMIKREAK